MKRLNKVCELETYALSEDNMIAAWVESFIEVMRTLDAAIIPYKGVDRSANYLWMKENPNSWITGV